jgi:hypothetical protein
MELCSFGMSATIWPIVSVSSGCQMMMSMEQLVEWELAGEPNYLGKPAPALLRPPQIAYDLTRDQTQATEVESQRLPVVWHDRNKSLLNISFHLFMVYLITLSLFWMTASVV